MKGKSFKELKNYIEDALGRRVFHYKDVDEEDNTLEFQVVEVVNRLSNVKEFEVIAPNTELLRDGLYDYIKYMKGKFGREDE